MSHLGKILSFIASGENFNKALKLCFTSPLFYCRCPLQDNSLNHIKLKKTFKYLDRVECFTLKNVAFTKIDN